MLCQYLSFIYLAFSRRLADEVDDDDEEDGGEDDDDDSD
jgi:hypothetical protein